MTKTDLISLGGIVKADLPLMGTKDTLAEAINERLVQIKAENLLKPFAPPKGFLVGGGKGDADDDDEVRSVAGTDEYFEILLRFANQGNKTRSMMVPGNMGVAALHDSVLKMQPGGEIRMVFNANVLEVGSLSSNGIAKNSVVDIFTTGRGGTKTSKFEKKGSHQDKKKKDGNDEDELKKSAMMTLYGFTTERERLLYHTLPHYSQHLDWVNGQRQ